MSFSIWSLGQLLSLPHTSLLEVGAYRVQLRYRAEESFPSRSAIAAVSKSIPNEYTSDPLSHAKQLAANFQAHGRTSHVVQIPFTRVLVRNYLYVIMKKYDAAKYTLCGV